MQWKIDVDFAEDVSEYDFNDGELLGCFLSNFEQKDGKSYSVTVTACDPCGSQSSNAKLEGMSHQVGLPLPGVSSVEWTLLAVISWIFHQCKITPAPRTYRTHPTTHVDSRLHARTHPYGRARGRKRPWLTRNNNNCR